LSDSARIADAPILDASTQCVRDAASVDSGLGGHMILASLLGIYEVSIGGTLPQ
jgi:hypothetical protein